VKYINTMVKYSLLTVGENPRIPTNLALDSLRDSIEGIGLLEPLTVWQPSKDVESVQIIRGHRRFASIGLIKQHNPSRFEELFGKGIPCLIVTGVTSEEVINLKLDHADQRGLSDPHELQRSANMLFAIGKTEAEVAMQLAGLIDKIAPMKQEARIELDALRGKYNAAKVANQADAAELADRDIRDFICKYRRGLVQGLHNNARCPDIVMAALYKKATGVAPEGVTVFLPKIGTAECTMLWKAHLEDLKIKENGMPKYNKAVVGPIFTSKWNSICEKAQKEIADGSNKDPKAKAMSAKDMNAEVETGLRKSRLACILTSYHAGDKSLVSNIPALDEASAMLDLIEKYDNAAYVDIIKAGREIEKRLIAAVPAATKEEAKA